MATAEENLTDWLRDAHAMEQQAKQMLEAQAGRIENYPDLKQRIEKHIDETEYQAEQLKQCLDRLGTDTSVIKDATGRFAAMGQAVGGMVTGDEVVKGGIASYAFEHFEIACYKSLIAAAQEVGDQQTERVCKEILGQEEAMASWLSEHLPETTHQFLQREQQPEATAKR